MSYTESVTVKMESGLKNRASNQAVEEKLSMSELGRKAMKAYLREKARMDIRRYGISKESVVEMISGDGWGEWRIDHMIEREDVTAAFRIVKTTDGDHIFVAIDDVERNDALYGDVVCINDDKITISSRVVGFNDDTGVLIVM